MVLSLLSLSLSLSQSSLSLCSGCLASVSSCEEMIHQVQANHQLLKEQVKMAMDDFKQLLDTRQAVSTHTAPVVLSLKCLNAQQCLTCVNKLYLLRTESVC